jgi:hypothetical protein
MSTQDAQFNGGLTSAVSDSTRRQVREGLQKHYGALSKVVSRTKELRPGGYHQRYVQMVLSGDRKNSQIISLAAKVLEEILQDKASIEADLTATVDRISSLNQW